MNIAWFYVYNGISIHVSYKNRSLFGRFIEYRTCNTNKINIYFINIIIKLTRLFYN